jgi:sulfur carrier protein
MGMSSCLSVQINGNRREFAALTAPTKLNTLIEALELKGDRIAVEHNGEIAARTSWPDIAIQNGDKLEIVHFVGGGFDEAL